MPYFEDFDLGDEIGPLEISASDEQVLDFCNIWERETPSRFTDAAAAAESGLPGPIVPGIMSMALMARLFTDWAGAGALKDMDVVFRQPVPHNTAADCLGHHHRHPARRFGKPDRVRRIDDRARGPEVRGRQGDSCPAQQGLESSGRTKGGQTRPTPGSHPAPRRGA